jgi:hypothetical protein
MTTAANGMTHAILVLQGLSIASSCRSQVSEVESKDG